MYEVVVGLGYLYWDLYECLYEGVEFYVKDVVVLCEMLVVLLCGDGEL